MGKPVSNPFKRIIRIKIGSASYGQLIALGESVFSQMTTNAAIFPTPTPSLATLQTATQNCAISFAARNNRRNKGSMAATSDLIAKAIDLRVLLLAELGYVEFTLDPNPDVPAYNAQLFLAGFSIRSKRSRVQRLQQPTFARQTNNKTFPFNMHRINWRKGLGLLKGLPVSGYQIWEAGKMIGTTTKGNFVVDMGVAASKRITIIPFNARGTGNSMSLTVR